jgi:hypothetical protein
MREFMKKIQPYLWYLLAVLLITSAGVSFFHKFAWLETTIYYAVMNIVAGLFLAQSARQSVKAMNFWARTLGVMYGTLSILGATMPDGEILSYFKFDFADNIVNALLALPMVYYGFHPPEHKPLVDHDVDLAAEVAKEQEEARLAALPALEVKDITVVDLRKPAPPKEEQLNT